MSFPQKMLDPNDRLSIREQCQLLGINRSSYYYKHKNESQENLENMRLMDTFFIDHPTYGVIYKKSVHDTTTTFGSLQGSGSH